MTPEEIGAHVVEALAPVAGDGAHGGEHGGEHGERADGGRVVATVSGGGAWARATVDVPPALWRTAAETVRDDPLLGLTFLDWLSAVDELDDGFRVVLHLWSVPRRHGLLLRTLASPRSPRVPSVVDIYPGAAWHEREAHEMFGIEFDGNPDLRPLLLPPEFEGHPLRKQFVLASRVAKPWPGAKEPGESDHQPAGRGRRQPARPPGVPAPEEWGPGARPSDGGEA